MFEMPVLYSHGAEEAADGRGALHWSARRSTLRYWAVGSAFIAAYVIIERMSFVYQLDGLGITLWSPSAGFSVIFLLLTGTRFAPFVFVASVITDYVVYTGPRGLFAPIGTSLVFSLGFAGLALSLAPAVSARSANLSRTLRMLSIVPCGVLLMAVFYCFVLYGCGLLPLERFFIAMRNFWIGDTLGIVTLLPAALTLAEAWSRRQRLRTALANSTVFAVLLVTALSLVFGLRKSHEYQFFYLMFIPVVWVAVRTGYAGVSLALPVAHVLIVSIAMHVSYAVYDFIAFQMLMLVLSASGLLLGAAVTEARTSLERMRAQESELARAAKHALVGATGTALAHEISQPLASATNYLHAARRLLGPDIRVDAAQALAKAETEARRVRETLERVRDYVSSGRVELSDLHPGEVAARISDLLRGDASAHGVRIGVVTKPHLPSVRADAIQLEQLLLNLITNAVDAASCVSPQGEVTITTSQRGDRLVVAVEDNGPGVASHVADRLFEPFETTKRNGMGLGLTLARQIVEAHNGSLHWQNPSTGGACFAVELRIDGPLSHER